MTGSTISGYAALSKGASLTPFTYEPPPLEANEVRIAITHCGLCGTDIQGIDNYYKIVNYPFVPGHEVVGHIIEVGALVPRGRIGERVGVGWQGRACMACEWCLKGEVNLCANVAHNGCWEPYGGFATSISVQEGFAYPIPDAMPSEVAAVLMCAGVTVYSALHKHAIAPSLKIGIFGIGGLGHLAIQFARAMGCEVTSISSSPAKRDEALSLGAHHFVVSSDQDTLDSLEYAFDLLLVTAHGGVEWDIIMDTLKKKGKLILVGFPDLKLNSIDLVAHELSITGSFLGTQADMCDMLHFAQVHHIQPMVEVMPMSKANEAIERVKQNQARYRIVLVNDLG